MKKCVLLDDLSRNVFENVLFLQLLFHTSVRKVNKS